jgi:DNA-binding NarL/FixJ family response regulator
MMPDVVVMDLAMPVMNGIEATRLIRAAQPMVRVLTVTMLGGQEQAAREAGAEGFLLKDADPAAIIAAVRSLA